MKPLFLAVLALLLISPMVMALDLIRYEQTTLDKLSSGQQITNDDVGIIGNAIYQRLNPGLPIPSLLQIFVGGYNTQIFVESSSYNPSSSAETGMYVGCLVTDATSVREFYPVDYQHPEDAQYDPCSGGKSKLSLHTTPKGISAIRTAIGGGQDATKAILHAYQNGIYLQSNDLTTNGKLFFAGIAGWFGGWFI